MWRVLLAALPLLLGGVDPVLAGEDVVTGHIDLFGKHLLLPPGEWRIVATAIGQLAEGDPGAYGAIGSVMLLPTSAEQPQAFVLLRTNAVPVSRGWGPPAECVNDGVLLQSVAKPHDLHNACSFVVAARSGRIAAASGDPSIAPLLPPWALVAGFRASDRNDVVEARYGIVPGSSMPSWFDASQALDAGQVALLRQLADWTRQARQASMAALRDPADQVTAIPQLTLAGLDPGTAETGEIDAFRRSLYQFASDRAPATAWNWALASALAGNVYVGATVAAWQSVTHSALSFGNEMAWDWPRDARTMAFAAPRAAPDMAATVIAGGFSLNGKRAPLPTGAWSILAEGQDAAVLGLLRGQALAALAVIRANPQPTSEILAAASDCSRHDIYFATSRYDTAVDGYCSYGKPVVPDEATAGDALWTAARERLMARGASLPPVLLEVGARARTNSNFLDVRYYFVPDPDLQGLPFAANRVAATPPVLDQVTALQDWADLLQLPLEQGVRGRLPQRLAILPWPWPREQVLAEGRRQVHAPLEHLHAVAALDDAALQRQMALADAELAERERHRWSLWSRSTYKVATYRLLSYFDAAAVSWIVTASPEQSLAYASINAVAQPVMGYLRQYGWVGSDAAQAAASRQPVDFPDIGNDRL